MEEKREIPDEALEKKRNWLMALLCGRNTLSVSNSEGTEFKSVRCGNMKWMIECGTHQYQLLFFR